MYTLVLILVKDTSEAEITQTHVVLVFIVLYYQKVALKGGCARENGIQTSNDYLHNDYVLWSLYCYHTIYTWNYPMVPRKYGHTDPETIEIGARR